MTSAVIQEQKKLLFDYWDNIPIILMCDEDQYDTIRDRPGKTNLRAHIISILAEGIEDTYPGEEGKRIRHALSAAEIKEELEKELDEEITSSNVYFHLQKLEEAELVKIVGSLPTGRRFTAYYGRVARAFMLESDEEFPLIHRMDVTEERYKKAVNDVFELIKIRNPDMDVNEIEELKSKVIKFNQHRLKQDKEYSDSFSNWIEDHGKHIIDLDINVIDIHMIFQDLLNYKTDFVETLVKFQKLLGVEEYSPKIDE